jgi:DNA-directed RNA polymerase specialized sigma24 family protein
MLQVYDELRAVARKYFRRERPNHTLQPTALVHEVFLRLAQEGQIDWKGRTHFLAAGARAMRRILVDHARRKYAVRHGGRAQRVQIDSGLSPEDTRQAEVVELRFFSGMTVDEIAAFLGVSKRTVEGDWTHAKAWLRAALSENPR